VNTEGLAESPAEAVVGPSAHGEVTTRDRILRDISTLGPITTTALVERLGVTQTAVRRHVENLLQDGLIEAHEAGGSAGHRRRRGRPAKSWIVSPRGHAHLRSDYDDLATDAVRFLADHAGRASVRAFADHRARELTSRCATSMPGPEASLADRTAGLVSALQREGFAATARPIGDAESRTGLTGIQLCQGHCPVQHVAAEFPEFCDAETEAFSDLLGVHVQRLATLAQGDHVCTTFVPTTSPISARTPTDQTESTTSEGSHHDDDQ